MTVLLYAFAAIGVITVTVIVIKGIRQFRKDMKSGPVGWGIPWGPG
jgi:hypothetical protein